MTSPTHHGWTSRWITFFVVPSAIVATLGLAGDGVTQASGDSAGDPLLSEELREMYEEDQSSRANWQDLTPEEMSEMINGDKERRERVLDILATEKLTTADDYFHAAMILQHGEVPEDFLVSHVLSTIAGFKGHSAAKWLSAASLDRYLHRIDRPQIFGTQYRNVDGKWSLDPIDGDLLSDGIRADHSTPTLAKARANADRFE